MSKTLQQLIDDMIKSTDKDSDYAKVIYPPDSPEHRCQQVIIGAAENYKKTIETEKRESLHQKLECISHVILDELGEHFPGVREDGVFGDAMFNCMYLELAKGGYI